MVKRALVSFVLPCFLVCAFTVLPIRASEPDEGEAAEVLEAVDSGADDAGHESSADGLASEDGALEVTQEPRAEQPRAEEPEDVAAHPSQEEPVAALAEASAGVRAAASSEPSLSSTTRNGFYLEPEGYIRAVASFFDFDESESDFIGRNQGFGLTNVRFGVRGTRDRVSFEVSADGAVAMIEQANTSRGRVAVRLADAYAGYEAIPGLLIVEMGQQKVPFDGETLVSNAELPFVRNSVWQRGVKGVEGFNVEGLGIDREIGFTLRGERIAVGSGPLAFSYATAVTNGTPASQPFNENSSLALYGRAEGHYRDALTLGAAVFHNIRTFGALPDLLDERYLGIAADLAFEIDGAWLRLDGVQLFTSFPDVDLEPARTSLGFSASFGYRTAAGIEPAYRLSFYDPTFSFRHASPALAAQLEANDLVHHTIGLSWVPDDQPVALQVNYTHARENPARAVRNDRVEILGRLVF